MLSENEKDLAKKAAKLTGSIISVIPGDAEKKKEILDLIAEESKIIADANAAPSDKPIKAISDNLTDTLHAIYPVLPDYEGNEGKQRAKARYKNSVNIIEGILNMIGL